MSTILLHNIGGVQSNANWNTIEEILDAEGTLTFDGVYRNVYEHRYQLKGKDIILFVTGNYFGLDNTFDKGQPLSQFCTWREVKEMEKLGFRLGWHTWSHRDLTHLSTAEVIKELDNPFGLDLLAYPYGNYNQEVIEIAKSLGYKDAWSVTQGDDTQFRRRRQYL